MKEITYDINSVVGRLSAKLANSEVQLAHTQSANEAYEKRVNELEKELESKNKKESVQDEPTNSKKK